MIQVHNSIFRRLRHLATLDLARPRGCDGGRISDRQVGSLSLLVFPGSFWNAMTLDAGRWTVPTTEVAWKLRLAICALEGRFVVAE